LEDIHCLGVAEGDVRILHWQGLRGAAPIVLAT
jgi:NhaP-type Na+/H+ and K+/H+ antiporter